MWGLDELIHVKYLKQSLAQSKYPVSISVMITESSDYVVFYRRGKWDAERLSNLPNVTEKGRPRLQNKVGMALTVNKCHLKGW